MSLLLQALQKAAKSRDEVEGEPTGSTPEGADQLSLEPIGSEPAFRDEMPQHSHSPTPAQAATVVQASRLPAFDPVGYARDHYMIVFLGAATLVAIIYGSYVYIQISNPGLFRSRPAPVAGPLASVPVPAAPAPPAEPPETAEKISGMPASTAPTSGAIATGSGASVFEDSKPTVRSTVAEIAPARAATTSRPRRAVRAAETTVSSEPSTVATADPPVETVVIKTNEAKGISVRRQPATLVPVDPTLMQAYEALQQGEFTQARTLYEQVLLVEPRSVDALLGLGAIAWKEGRVEEAGQRYQRVLELEPRNSYAQAGLIAIIGGADPQASESRLRQLIAREPSAFLYFTLGNLYADQGQWPGAEQAYFQAYQLQPDNADYAFNLAVGLEHIGQTRPALDYYRKALDLSFRKGRANFDQNLVIQRVGQLSARVE
jgi:Flp pilus assembly protein TadD